MRLCVCGRTGIKNCRTSAALLSDPNCHIAVKNGLQYIAYVANAKIFGDSRRRVYGVVANPSFAIFPARAVGTLPTPIFTETAVYDTTNRLWYVKAIGWSAQYQFSSGSQGRSYSVPVLDAQGSVVGVSAGDRCRPAPPLHAARVLVCVLVRDTLGAQRPPSEGGRLRVLWLCRVLRTRPD